MHRIPAIILAISVQYFRVLSKYHHPPPYLYFPSPLAESHNSLPSFHSYSQICHGSIIEDFAAFASFSVCHGEGIMVLG